MRTQTILLTILITVAWSVASSAQTGDAGDEGRREPVAAVSAPLIDGSPAFRSELERKNYLDAGIGFGSTFDDNALSTPSNPKADTTFGVFPNLALKQTLGRLNWQLDYFGGFTAHQRFSAYNQGSHDFGLEGSYKLAEHVDLFVRDHFVMTTGFFDQINPNPYTSAGSILSQPNQSVITPLSKQSSNLATVAVNDQFSASSAVGGSGTFYRLYYKDAPPGSILLNTDSFDVEGYYNRRLSARNSMGVTYRFQRFTFSDLGNDTNTHSVLLTYAFHPDPNMTLSVFAGPEYVDMTMQLMNASLALPQLQLSAVSADHRFWRGTGGASFAWNGLHTGLTASVVRSINDGGGLLGAVGLTNTNIGLRRQLSRRLTAGLGFDYGLSDAIGTVLTPYSSIKSAVGSVSVSRQVRNNFGFTLGYSRVFQSQATSAGAGSPDINHNRAWASISYQFSRPLGR